MIKYFQLDSIDEYGVHITPIEPRSNGLIKLASNNYSKEIVDAIAALKRESQYYYVVINALGSYEVWGANRNGDAFPREGLSHYSLRSDMGTENDYGYKTFEYLAKLYKNHVNKDPDKSFGKVLFSHWNQRTDRVELIVGIDKFKGKDIVEAIENDELISVSMGCLINPEYPILTKNGYKPIKDVIIGDEVMTHKKRWKKIVKLNRNVYSGKIVKLFFRGLPFPLDLTDNHPMMSKMFKCESENKLRPIYQDNIKADWHAAGLLEKKDHIEYIPCSYDKTEFSAISDERLAKVMGYYLAEGSFGYNYGKPNVIEFNCHIDDDLPRELPLLIRDMYPDITCSQRPHSRSSKGLVVDVFSTRLSCMFYKLMGKGSKTKFIPPEIFISNDNIKIQFIAGWFSGDGWLDEKGMHISTASINLVLQGRDMLSLLKIPSSIYRIIHPAGSGFNHHETIEYILNISAMDCEIFAPYSTRKMSKLNEILSDRITTGNSAIRFNLDQTLSYSINDIEKYDVENVETYNFEVEEDESYSAAGLVSHNCKVKWDECNICGNKSSKTSQYCKHLKKYMGKIVTKDIAELWSTELKRTILPGTMVFAWNRTPKFFDISKVYVGAEPVAYLLGKVASSNHIIPSAYIAEAEGVTDEMIDKLSLLGKSSVLKKDAEIDKEFGGPEAGDLDGKVIAKGKSEALKKIIDSNLQDTISKEEPIPNTILDLIAKNVGLSNIFSTMMGLGIHPKPAEFQRIIIIKAGRPDIADFLDKNNMVFDPNAEVEPIDVPIGREHFDINMAKLLENYMDKRSCFPDFLEPRMEKKAFLGQPEDKKIISPMNILIGLTALFAGLKMKSMGVGAQQMLDTFRTQPWIGTLLGAGLAYKLLAHDRGKQIDRLLIPADRYQDAFTDTYFSGHPMSKTASVGTSLAIGGLAGLATLPAAYILNAYHRKSMYEKGQPLFPGSGVSPITAAKVVGGGTALASLIKENYGKELMQKIKGLK